jgi:uncharacterized protein YjbJ (UPF0337 family)
MNKDQFKGAAQKLKGSIEQTVGKVVGSKKLEADGRIDKAAGSVRAAVGKGRDAIRSAGKALKR